MKKKVLIIEPEKSLARLLSLELMNEGHIAETAHSAQSGLKRALEKDYDLILLDAGLSTDGEETLVHRLQEKQSGYIIMLMSRDSAMDVISVLEDGADAYITKPFAIDELVARIKAHLRRQARLGENTTGSDVLRIGEIALDRRQLTVTRGGVPVDLSTREFELLDYLMRNAGQTLSREKIFRDVWKTEYGDIGTVAINIKNLRAKIDPDWAYIKTVWGSGYQFVSRSSFGESKQTEAR